ncbi:hypothetical protein HS088_TW04G00601 [Tripterygium wilfordii]|uniref:FLZ-type domain-containing protein n=1 Tax=Tripterygium wilfordii TaxID=458696 RepID=A0A7J7DQS6_TRIWF|nr:FCS-Like Zinc finger 14-like [Tripterygium wilfordii]KAF5748643.1 hypothetical protein HS088_TW04G00601 [Tripterygium wilfordii]
MEKKKSQMSLSLFTTLSNSFTMSTKSPRNFQDGVVGLGIVAAMSDSSDAIYQDDDIPSGRSSPIPIVLAAKPAANFRGGLSLLNLERGYVDEGDEENYTCVISHLENKKRVYFDDSASSCVVMDIAGDVEKRREFWASDFLNSCSLCNKKLRGLDIFMYRGEKAFCSLECRDKHIRSDDHKEKCGSEARTAIDYSMSPCSSPQVFFNGVAAA